MQYDIWFTRYEDKLFSVAAIHDEAPMARPVLVSSVRSALRNHRKAGMNIIQTGIVPADMIGLE